MTRSVHNISQDESREIRRNVGRRCRFFLTYQLLFIGVTVLGFLIVSAPYFFAADTTSAAIDDLIYATGGRISLMGLLISGLYVMLSQRKTLVPLLRRKSAHTMSFSSLALVIVLLFAAQSVFSLVFAATEHIANRLGYTALEVMASEPTDLSYLLYAALLGPIMEEIVFRGVLLNGLIGYGKTFAITISAILFAIFHADVAQGTFALFCGLILGYVAVEYSLKWAIFIHIFNNFAISTVLSGALARLPGEMQHAAGLLFIVLGLLGGALVLLGQRKQIGAYPQQNAPRKGMYRAALASRWFLLSIVLGIGMMASSFSPL